MGGGPLRISDKALKSFKSVLERLTLGLREIGAVGPHGPDFLITSDDEANFEPDTCLLIELNARVPYTAVPLEIVKQVRGNVGHGFFSRHVKLSNKIDVSDVFAILKSKNLLITEKSENAKGVVPYNVGLLPWNIFDIAIMASSWDETQYIANQIDDIFSLHDNSRILTLLH